MPARAPEFLGHFPTCPRRDPVADCARLRAETEWPCSTPGWSWSRAPDSGWPVAALIAQAFPDPARRSIFDHAVDETALAVAGVAMLTTGVVLATRMRGE